MKTILSLAILFFASAATFAQNTTEIWTGALDIKVAKLRL